VRIFLDTNVLIAASLGDHIHHERAKPLLAGIHDGTHEGFTSGHAVLELYSVVTRSPRPMRMPPAQASALIQENILKYFTVVTLGGREYGSLVLRMGVESAIGGQAYDALHLACAQKCNAERIYTFNARHFQNLTAEDFRSRIVEP
jgi:predicted nucleic acid-binding protein